jgi:hypothetical protein
MAMSTVDMELPADRMRASSFKAGLVLNTKVTVRVERLGAMLKSKLEPPSST